MKSGSANHSLMAWHAKLEAKTTVQSSATLLCERSYTLGVMLLPQREGESRSLQGRVGPFLRVNVLVLRARVRKWDPASFQANL